VNGVAVHAQVTVELLLAPECPHADAARSLLVQSLRELQLDVAVMERVGDFPSPTILVDGRDVMTGGQLTSAVSACRMDVPTERQLRRALHDAIRPGDAGPQDGPLLDQRPPDPCDKRER
jgi:hypothetical protein